MVFYLVIVSSGVSNFEIVKECQTYLDLSVLEHYYKLKQYLYRIKNYRI